MTEHIFPEWREDNIDVMRERFRKAGITPTPIEPDYGAEPTSQKPTGENKVTALDIDQFLAASFPPRVMMLAPLLSTSAIIMIHALRGTGKTHIAHGMGIAVATGTSFLRWSAPRPYRVLLIDGEMPREDLQARLKKASWPVKPDADYFRIAAADVTENGLPDLSDPKAQGFYADVIADADLVIVDNISTLCRSIKENEADSWLPVQMWALSLRRAGKSVLFIHHAGKSGAQRGTSRKEDVLDTVIALRRPPDYTADQGCRFEVVYEKSRGFHGPDAAPFEAALDDGRWTTSDIKPADSDDALKALHKAGLSVRDISERTGVPRSTVSRKLNGGLQ